MSFPIHRMRRLRRTEKFRAMVRETRLDAGAFIYPMFVCPGSGVRNDISSMPGQFSMSVDNAVSLAQIAERVGVGGIMLFGIPEEKDEVGSGAYADDGIVQGSAAGDP